MHTFLVDKSRMKAMIVALSPASKNCPFGLLILEHILANLALDAIPAEMVMFVLGKS